MSVNKNTAPSEGEEQHLSEEKIAELRSAFQLFDKDNDGKITTFELGDILRKLQYEPTEEDLKNMISYVDTSKDGSIDFAEFLELMCSKMSDHDTEEEMLEAFRIFDRDSNGYVTRLDFKAIMKHLGENIMEDELDELMKDNDEDQDGQLNYEECKQMMTF